MCENVALNLNRMLHMTNNLLCQIQSAWKILLSRNQAILLQFIEMHVTVFWKRGRKMTGFERKKQAKCLHLLCLDERFRFVVSMVIFSSTHCQSHSFL